MIQTNCTIEGMACSMCESHINDAIRKNFPVRKVSSSHKKNETTILSDEPLNTDKLKSVIAQSGYALTNLSFQTVQKKSWFHR